MEAAVAKPPVAKLRLAERLSINAVWRILKKHGAVEFQLVLPHETEAATTAIFLDARMPSFAPDGTPFQLCVQVLASECANERVVVARDITVRAVPKADAVAVTVPIFLTPAPPCPPAPPPSPEHPEKKRPRVGG